MGSSFISATISDQTRRDFTEALLLYGNTSSHEHRTAEIRLNRIPTATRIALVAEMWQLEEAVRQRRNRKYDRWGGGIIVLFVLLSLAFVFWSFRSTRNHVSYLPCWTCVINFINLGRRRVVRPSGKQKALLTLLASLPSAYLVPAYLDALHMAEQAVEREMWLKRLTPLLSEFVCLDASCLTRNQQKALLQEMTRVRHRWEKDPRQLNEGEMDFMLASLQLLSQQAAGIERKRLLTEIKEWATNRLASTRPSACIHAVATEYRDRLACEVNQPASAPPNKVWISARKVMS